MDVPRAAPPVEVTCSPGFVDWLEREGIALAFTTYQTHRLFLVGRGPGGRLAAFERLLDRPMGLAADRERLWVATRYQLWRFDQVLADGETHRGHDRLYVPRAGHVTGELDAHDVALDGAGEPVFVNTLYSCLARLDARHSFAPLWRPPFVGALAPEDRCHLNGVAMEGGRPRYATAAAATDAPGGWRERRGGGGVVVDVASGETVVSGLSMPHSPRLREGELWLLDSGRGDLGRVDLAADRFEPVAFLPGYLRGLAFHGGAAVVGLSKPRDRTFHGLPLDERLAAAGRAPACGLAVVDLASGEVLHTLTLEGVVTELYDVAVIPGTVRPMALGFRSDELRRTVTFEADGHLVHHRLERLEEGVARPESSPLPEPSTPGAAGRGSVERSADGPRGSTGPAVPAPPPAPAGEAGAAASVQVGTLPLAEALRGAAFTFPDLRRTARGRRLADPLVAAAAAAPGRPPHGLALAQVRPGTLAGEVLSLWVHPDGRRRGLAGRLLAAVEAELARRGAERAELAFRAGWPGAEAVRRLLAARGWSPPAARLRLATVDERILPAARRLARPLPAGYELFPWSELTADERRDVVRRQQREAWFPPALSPFQMDEERDDAASLGLRRDGRVIGWVIGHRVGPEVVQYTALWVEEGHRRIGRGIPLLLAALERQLEAGIPRAIFQIDVANRPMIELLERHMRPHLAAEDELLGSVKRLGDGGPAAPEPGPAAG